MKLSVGNQDKIKTNFSEDQNFQNTNPFLKLGSRVSKCQSIFGTGIKTENLEVIKTGINTFNSKFNGKMRIVNKKTDLKIFRSMVSFSRLKSRI